MLNPLRKGAGVRSLAAIGLVAMIVASCTASSPKAAPEATGSSGSLVSGVVANGLKPTAAPTPQPTPEPTPEPTATIPTASVDELELACKGTPVPEADAYASSLHPMVVARQSTNINGWALDTANELTLKWDNGTWLSPIQLVACISDEVDMKVGSCGSYRRFSDGKVGTVVRYHQAITVKIVVAKTGKVIQSKSFYGTTPKCSSQVEISSDPPPWKIYGGYPSDAAISSWILAVSTQKAR